MNSRLVLFTALLVAVIAVSLAGARFARPSGTTPAIVRGTLPAAPASYLGVYEDGVPPGYQPVARFGRAAHQLPNLAGYYSGGAQPFELAFARRIHAHHVSPFVQIDPTYASMNGIAAGYYDGYLRSYADDVRAFGHPVVIGFGHEMNGPWYSWGYWVGIDGYYYRSSDTFASVFGRTIRQVRNLTTRPVLLSETAVGPRAGQFIKISDLFHGMTSHQLLGLVWFDKDQGQTLRRQDWRIEGNTLATNAFELAAASMTLTRR